MPKLNEIIIALIEIFKRDDVKATILDEYWLQRNRETRSIVSGFCYASSVVIYRLTGGKNIWLLKSISNNVWNEGTHYYLQHKQTNEILDITSQQYTARGIDIPYCLGRGRGLQNTPKKAIQLAGFCGWDLNQEIAAKYT